MFESQTVAAAREIVERYRQQATKQMNHYNKMKKDQMAYQPTALTHLSGQAGFIEAGYMYYIWYEVVDQLKKLSHEITDQLQPVESLAAIKSYAASEEKLGQFIKENFGEIYAEGKKAKLNIAELAILLLQKVSENNG